MKKLSPLQSRELIFKCEEKGSFQTTWHENKVENKSKPTLNDDYINFILKMTSEQLARLQKRADESMEEFINRFSKDQEMIYNECYGVIKSEMNLNSHLTFKIKFWGQACLVAFISMLSTLYC